jgi:hypothetical protein
MFVLKLSGIQSTVKSDESLLKFLFFRWSIRNWFLNINHRENFIRGGRLSHSPPHNFAKKVKIVEEKG